jgi:hypothetical protein
MKGQEKQVSDLDSCKYSSKMALPATVYRMEA